RPVSPSRYRVRTPRRTYQHCRRTGCRAAKAGRRTGYCPAVADSPKAARLRSHRRLDPARAGDVPVSASVGPAGEAVLLWATPADRQALLARSRDGRSPRSRPPAPVTARVTTHHADAVEVVPLDALDLTYCEVQPLPGGRILVVGARARGGVTNATVYDDSGRPVAQGRLGDGIEHVQATPTGRIWVGYFDEGVYGDDPVAHHGIVRFTSDLTPEWTYP